MKFEKNRDVFALSLALCGWGYEKVYSKRHQVPKIYQTIQQEIRNDFDFSGFDQFFYKTHPSELHRFILGFEPTDEYGQFQTEFSSFITSIDIEKYFKLVEPFIDKEISKYQQNIGSLILDIAKLFSLKELELPTITIIPNYLAIIGSGSSHFDGERVIILMGPPNSERENLSGLIVHEYLHSIINPATQKIFTDRESPPPIGALAQNASYSYKYYWTTLNEYLIRALTIKILGKDVEKVLQREKEKRGFVKISAVYKVLEKKKKINIEADLTGIVSEVKNILIAK